MVKNECESFTLNSYLFKLAQIKIVRKKKKIFNATEDIVFHNYFGCFLN